MSESVVTVSHESRRVANGDATIHYLDCTTGTPADALTPIVFVPGMSCVSQDYATIAEHTGRRTIVIDLRGHGLSTAPAHGYRLDDHASDIAAVVDDALAGGDHSGDGDSGDSDSGDSDGDVHLMTFSRGTCYALRWCERTDRRVRSVTIGDYPGREIPMTSLTADSFLAGRWRGTPVVSRLDVGALRATFAESADRPLWHVLSTLAVPTAVVRSTAPVPITDDDWIRYATVTPGIRLDVFDDSPHDIFRRDRGRFGRLAAESARLGDDQVASLDR